jgi:hypothetical protein
MGGGAGGSASAGAGGHAGGAGASSGGAAGGGASGSAGGGQSGHAGSGGIGGNAGSGGSGGQATGGQGGGGVGGTAGSGTGGGGGSTVSDAGTDAATVPDTCTLAPDASTLSSGLVSWWRAEGNANDDAGPNGGSAQNGVTYVTGPMGGRAFEFNGTSADVLIPTSTTLNVTSSGLTIAFWIKVQSWPSQSTLVINKWVNGQEDKSIIINANGTISFYLASAAAPLMSATALTPNVWHHVAAVYNGTDQNIYIDGQFDASDVVSGGVLNSTGSLTFAHNAARGAAEATSNTFFAGDLDEIRWYSRGLSGPEVSELHAGCK